MQQLEIIKYVFKMKQLGSLMILRVYFGRDVVEHRSFFQ